MEDICFSHLCGQECPNRNESGDSPQCPNAHSFSELANLNQWVTFDAPDLQMLDFLAYKYYSHPTFKWYTFPSGPVVRFASAEDAHNVMIEYKKYHNPQKLTIDRSLEKPEGGLPSISSDFTTLTRSPNALAMHSRPIAVRRNKKNIGEALETCIGMSAFGQSFGSDGMTDSALNSFATEDAPQSSTPPSSNPTLVFPDLAPTITSGAPQTICSPFDVSPITSPVSPGSAASLFNSSFSFNAQLTVNQLMIPPPPVLSAIPTSPLGWNPHSAPVPNGHHQPNPLAKFHHFKQHRKNGKPVEKFTPNDRWSAACIDMVLNILRESTLNLQFLNTGWQVLLRMWNIRAHDLDTAVLSYLWTKPVHQQERILLSFAAINLSNVKNLSAYLCSLIKQHETTNQVCIRFLAGFCPYSSPMASNHHQQHRCEYVHPINTFGWNNLFERWQLTYRDFDYTVLNYLSTKTLQQQDEILISLAGVDLPVAKNLSACLSTLIQKNGDNASIASMNKPSNNHRSNDRRQERRRQAKQQLPFHLGEGGIMKSSFASGETQPNSLSNLFSSTISRQSSCLTNAVVHDDAFSRNFQKCKDTPLLLQPQNTTSTHLVSDIKVPEMRRRFSL